MIALTRAVSPKLIRCERTHRPSELIDVERAARQHAAYEAALEELGCRVERVEPAPHHPDAVFVEDTAVVLDEVAILARPGAASRRGEVTGVAAFLERHRPVRRLTGPATLDGGDVLRVGQSVWVGQSSRTNRAAVAQLRNLLEPLGYRIHPVPVTRCLHLKSAVTAVAADTVVLNPRWVDPGHWAGFRTVMVDPAEPEAANVLRIGRGVIVSASHARTRDRLDVLGLNPIPVEMSELEKAEGGVTCCSILLSGSP